MNDFIKTHPCEIFSFSAGCSLRGLQPKSTALDIHIHTVCYLRSSHEGYSQNQRLLQHTCTKATTAAGARHGGQNSDIISTSLSSSGPTIM